jgi:hypothetical protein
MASPCEQSGWPEKTATPSNDTKKKPVGKKMEHTENGGLETGLLQCVNKLLNKSNLGNTFVGNNQGTTAVGFQLGNEGLKGFSSGKDGLHTNLHHVHVGLGGAQNANTSD